MKSRILVGCVLVMSLAGNALAALVVKDGALVVQSETGTRLPRAKITITFNGTSHEAETDDDGAVPLILIRDGQSATRDDDRGGAIALTGDGEGRIMYPGGPTDGELFVVKDGALQVPNRGGPPAKQRQFGLDISGSYGNLNENPVSGQGFTKQSGSPESRTAATPDNFSLAHFGVRLRLGAWFAGYDKALGNAEGSGMAAPGRNGDLFLGVNERGNNGRIFTGFATEEEIVKDFDTNRVQAGRQFPVRSESHVAVYGYFDKGTLTYRSDWNVSRFPDARSETEHRTTWNAFGLGLEAMIGPVFSLGEKVDFFIKPDAWAGRGSYKYEGKQAVLNPPAPEDDFSAADQVERTVWGSDIEAILRIEAARRMRAEIFFRIGVETLPTLQQVNGDQLSQGQQDGLDFVEPRRYFIGARLRF